MERIAIVTGIYIFSAGFAAAIAILHFLLYLFYPRQRANLFFSIFAAGVVMRQFTSDVLNLDDFSRNIATLILTAKEFSIAIVVFAFVLFLYSAFARRISALYWIALTGWVLLAMVDAVYK